MRCFSYIRFSKKKQEKGASLARQKKGSAELCQRKGWTLDPSSMEDLGVSAYRGKNKEDGALGVFLDGVKAGKIPTPCGLVVESLDRLSREKPRRAMSLFSSLLDCGVTIATVEPERIYYPDKTNDMIDLIEPLCIMARANEESETKSVRVRQGLAKKRLTLQSRIFTAHCHSWLKAKEDKTGFVVIPAKAAIVKRMFALAISGFGAASIASKFNAEGVPPLAGAAWDHSYIHKVLRGRAVVGEYQPCVMDGSKRVPTGPLLKNYFPAVISEEDWTKANGVISARKKVGGGRRGPTTSNLFSGLLVDASDGCKMRLLHKGEGYAYVVSVGAMRGQKGSAYRGFPYRVLEIVLLCELRELKPDALLAEEKPNLAAEIGAQRALVADLSNRIERIKERMETEEGLDTLLDLIARLEANKRATIDRIARLTEDQATPQTDILTEIQSDLTPAEQHTEEALGSFLSVVSLNGEQRERLQSKLRQLIDSIWIQTTNHTKFNKTSKIQVYFKSGKTHAVEVHLRRREMTIAKIEGIDLRQEWTNCHS